MRNIVRTRHLDTTVDGLTVHYREAGVPSSSAIVMLHGSPASSHSFREILPALADDHYVIAPDLIGFGFSDAPDPARFDYTFEHLADIVDGLLRELGVERFVVYVTDFSTPVGYYLATRSPERVTGIVLQNGNVHDAGIGEVWDTARRYWAEPSAETRAACGDWFTLEGTRDTYLGGLPERLVPAHAREAWHLDGERLSRPGNIDIHERLFFDYGRHVARFPEIAEYHRIHQPPCLVLWGRHDAAFDLAEVFAFASGPLEVVEAHVYDGGHFLTETHRPEIAARIDAFARDLRETQPTRA